jgi:dTDP-3-amino-3,4,6-trideoxy-alpha-D-glucose transaminase
MSVTEIPFLDLKATYRELKAPLDAAFARVMESGWFVHGHEVREFEAEFGRYVGGTHVVGVGNGLDALALMLKAAGIGPGDEVIVPAHTFIATWLAVDAVGATVAPVDVLPGTGNIDPERVAARVSGRTRAVLAVHLYGQPAAMHALSDVCRQHGLRLMEDAAQAHGARLDGRPAGTLGEAAGFSFYPGKNLGAYGDGGAVVTSDSALAERIRLLANYGSREKYQHTERGQNSRLDELQAALLRVRLAALDEWTARRRALAARYLEGLSGLPDISLPEVIPGAEPVWHLFVVRHPNRDAIRSALTAAGIQTLVHYPVPPHRSLAYADLGAGPGTFPVAEELAATVLSLPIGPHLSFDAADRVVEAVRRAVR